MFYLGVVEDNSTDPLKLGRLKVRIFGVHTDNKNDFSTADLPWCLPVSPNIGNISEVCSFSVPEQGSWVICSFLDVELQQPFYIGTVPRVEMVKGTSDSGFVDPAGVYPLSANSGRTSISKVATGETGILSNKPAVKSGDLLTEPATAYGAAYPTNKTIQTKSGHVLEFDDTSGAERIQVMHKSGTFIEFHPDGKLVIHTKAAQYLVSDNTLNIYGEANINIETPQDLNIKAANINMESESNTSLTAGGNLSETITGNITTTGAVINTTASGAHNLKGAPVALN